MKPEELNFHVNYDVVDPFALYDNIPQPEYLEITNYDEQMQDFERHAAAAAQTKGQDEEDSMLNGDINESRMSQRSERRT